MTTGTMPFKASVRLNEKAGIQRTKKSSTRFSRWLSQHPSAPYPTFMCLTWKQQVSAHLIYFDLILQCSFLPGFIKPHVDSTRYCGNTISGISLLSDSVMKLVQTSDDHSASEDYRNQPNASTDAEKKDLCSVKILLKRYSLYIMANTARYNYTHEILKNEESVINNQPIMKDRRISIICRNAPSTKK